MLLQLHLPPQLYPCSSQLWAALRLFRGMTSLKVAMPICFDCLHVVKASCSCSPIFSSSSMTWRKCNCHS